MPGDRIDRRAVEDRLLVENHGWRDTCPAGTRDDLFMEIFDALNAACEERADEAKAAEKEAREQEEHEAAERCFNRR